MRRSHHMPKRWLVKRRWLVILKATTYTYMDIWAAAIVEVLACSREPTNDGKSFADSHKIHVFLCTKLFL